MSEPSNPQPSGARPKWPVSVDAVIALGVALLTCHVVWTTPQFAASLPQDAADYAIPAVNLLERGRLVVSAYGLDFPPVHPPGMPLLLVPAYMLTGHFLGNGIYAILFCSAAMVALTYWIGVKLGGRYCGCAAALFLIWNYSFWEYSHKIMSEVPSALLGVLVLGLLLAIGDSKRPGMICLAVGAIIGFAVTVRNDSLLLLAAAIPLLAWKSATRERARRLGLVLVGTAPFVIGQAVYNRSAYGSPWRTGYHYWGSAGSTNRPLFSAGYITRTGFMRLEGITNDDPLAEGNATLYLKSLLDQADASDIFINYPRGRSSTVRFHRAMTLVRTGLGVLGLVACVTTWRTNPLRRKFFVWAILITVACFGFFLLYYYRDQRFLARLVPVFCLADGIGVAALLVKWPSPAARVVVVVFVAALIRWYMIATLGMGLPKGEPQRIYEGLTGVAGQIESNAVIVTSFGPLLFDAYVIRGTDRRAVPLAGGDDIAMFRGSPAAQIPPGHFVASSDPERLRQLVRSGLPVYWLIDAPWRKRPARDLYTLAQTFTFTVLANIKYQDGPDLPFFGRINEPTPVP